MPEPIVDQNFREAHDLLHEIKFVCDHAVELDELLRTTTDPELRDLVALWRRNTEWMRQYALDRLRRTLLSLGLTADGPRR